MRYAFLLLFLCVSGSIIGQTSSPYAKFGKISSEDLRRTLYPLDSQAGAVVLCDIGQTSIVGNSKGWFSISNKRHRVVHILKKNGYEEADVAIPLYSEGDDEESLKKLKAITYNLENGKVVESKLEKGSVFKEKKSAQVTLHKFTFPMVREGSIIEYEYEVVSDYISNLDPWYFQGSAPVLWSEFIFSVPQFFSFAFLRHGYHPFHLNDRKDRTDQFVVISDTKASGPSDRISLHAGVTDFRWVMKDVPELKQESYSSAIKNHMASLEFQMASQNAPLEPMSFRSTWPMLAKSLMSADYFGARLEKENPWLGDDLKPLLNDTRTETEKARRIYEFVRDHFSCTRYSGIYISQPLRNVMKARKGNVAEINLLLTAMLRYAGLEAHPVLISTKDHGYALENYPMITSFNYVLVKTICDQQPLILDGSQPSLGFGKLLPECYNGHGRLLTEEAPSLYLIADSLKEKSFTSCLFIPNEKGKLSAKMHASPGYYESYNLRNKIKEAGEEAYFNTLEKGFISDARISSFRVDSLTRYDMPLALKYEVEMEPFEEDIVYLNPMFSEGIQKNPFEAAQRRYPVELPFTMDQTYTLTMEVPEGYVVDELPKQIIAKMDEAGSGYFEYRISQSGNTISLRTIIRFGKTVFHPDEYENLRSFFNLIVSRHSGQIVFKKKK